MLSFGKQLRAISWGHKFNADLTNTLEFKDGVSRLPIFRVMDLQGKILNPKYENIPKETLLKAYSLMRHINLTDGYLITAQR